MAIIAFLIMSAVITLFTGYMIYLPFSYYSVGVSVTNLMYVIALFGIMWHSMFDVILHNLFSKQLVVVEWYKFSKFHIKNAISVSVWLMSLMWAILLFLGITINQQEDLDYYPIYIIVIGLFYSLGSLIRIAWRNKKNWWIYDILFALLVKITIKGILSILYLFVFIFF